MSIIIIIVICRESTNKKVEVDSYTKEGKAFKKSVKFSFAANLVCLIYLLSATHCSALALLSDSTCTFQGDQVYHCQ